MHESISNDLEFNIRCSHSQNPQIPDQPPACTFSSTQACVCHPLLILFCLLSGTSLLNALLSHHPTVSLQTSPSGTHTPHLQKTLNVRLSLVLNIDSSLLRGRSPGTSFEKNYYKVLFPPDCSDLTHSLAAKWCLSTLAPFLK